MSSPIKIHPKNSRIFEFRGKPLVLLCATEHYGAVINRPFDFEKYLADAAEKKQTLSRLFVLFRELQSHCNPYSTCKPESPDYISPFMRTGPGKALDGEPKYDLDVWNPEFFDRLHRFLSLASSYGIIIELTLFSNTYAPQIWALNPLNAKNNLNDLEEIEWTDYLTLRSPKLLERQLAHLKKIVEETNHYDHIIYEICNEPGGGFPGNENNPSPAEINEWQMLMAKTIVETEANLPNKHLIVGQEAFTYDPWEQSSDLSFHDLKLDVVNIHPLPNTTYQGKSYDMGVFMSKQLKLREIRDYCLATKDEAKPLNLDEDNVASQYKDVDGWTIHRKRSWTTLMSGCHYDYIDFTINNYMEQGTPESQRYIRTWMKHLSQFIHSIDLVQAQPGRDWLLEKPSYLLETTLAIEGMDYCIYLADERELDDPGYGERISGEVVFTLPQGNYRIACFSPETGEYSPSVSIKGGEKHSFYLESIKHDIVIRIQKKDG